jgi:ankyrin repeat protein
MYSIVKKATMTTLALLLGLGLVHPAQGMQNEDLQEQFMRALDCRKISTVQELIHKVDVNKGDISGHTALICVCAGTGEDDDTLKIVQLLLDNKANPNKPDNYGITPLGFALWQGNFKIANLLVARGAHINNRNPLGYTLLHDACRDDRLDIVTFLVNNGADINTQATYDKRLPLSCVCVREKRSYLAVARFLIARNAIAPDPGFSRELPPDWQAIHGLFLATKYWERVQKENSNIEESQEYHQAHRQFLHNNPVSALTLLLRNEKLAQSIFAALDTATHNNQGRQTMLKISNYFKKSCEQHIKFFNNQQALAQIKKTLVKKLADGWDGHTYTGCDDPTQGIVKNLIDGTLADTQFSFLA